MIENVLTSVLILGSITLALAIGLAFASKRFAAKENPKVEKVFAALPQTNCGACGYPSCLEFAKALVDSSCKPLQCCAGLENTVLPAEPLHCRMGGQKVADEVSIILGIKVTARDDKVAVLLCKKGSHDKFDYRGVHTCHAASIICSGPKACEHSCIGFGDCVKVCQFGALSIEDGFLMVSHEKCTGCGLCVRQCPKNALLLKNRLDSVTIKCHAHECPGNVVKNCTFGCISCGICVKKCPKNAIKIEGNLAVIDYRLCSQCGDCISVCPRKVIERIL